MCVRRCAWMWVAVVAYVWRCSALEDPRPEDFNATQWAPWPWSGWPTPAAQQPSTPSNRNVPISEWYNNEDYTIDGKATYYGTYQNGGACLLDQGGGVAVPPEIANIAFTVAMNTAQYNMGSCGMCIKLRGDGSGAGRDPVVGEYKVYVNNLCPECQWGHLDFGINGDGLWNIQWKAVPCDVGSNNMKYALVNSNTWYLRISPQATRYPVKSMQIYYQYAWVTGTKTSNQMYEFKSNNRQFMFPLMVRTTSIFDQTVEDVIWELPGNKAAPGSVQFDVVPNAEQRLNRLLEATGHGLPPRHLS